MVQNRSWLWSQDPLQKQGMKCCNGETHVACLWWIVRGDAVGWGTTLQTGGSRVRFSIVSLAQSFRPQCYSGIDSTSNRNENQEFFFGGKGSRCEDLKTLPTSFAECLKMWKPQPPGTLRACPGIASAFSPHTCTTPVPALITNSWQLSAAAGSTGYIIFLSNFQT